MNTDIMVILDLFILGCGIYCFYTYYKIRVAGRLFPNALLIPGGKQPKDCLDAKAFLEYMAPRILILGILITLAGAILVLNAFIPFMSTLGSSIVNGAAFIVLVWYAIISSKANRQWW